MSAPAPPSSAAPAPSGDCISGSTSSVTSTGSVSSSTTTTATSSRHNTNSTDAHTATSNNSYRSDDEDDRVFFTSRSYKCKDDVIAAVAEYNHMRRRAYKVHTSDRRRYQVRCVDDACAFVVRFAFSTAFKPPTCFYPHSCSISDSVLAPAAAAVSSGSSKSSRSTTATADGASAAGAEDTSAPSASTGHGGVSSAELLASRACRATQIARYPEVRALVAAHGEQLKAAWIKDVLVRNGLRPTYANCFHARKRLLHEFAEDPHAFIEQQQSRRGYVLSLTAFAPTSAPASAPAATGTSTSDSSDSASESLCPDASGAASASVRAPASARAPSVKRLRTDDDSAAVSTGTSSTASITSSTSTSSNASTSNANAISTRIGDLLALTAPQMPASAPPASPDPQASAPSASPVPQAPAPVATTEPDGCCFICPAAAVPSAETQELLLQWQVRDPERTKTLVDLYDGSRRIEILRSGTYRLHVYIEPVGSSAPSLPPAVSLRTPQSSGATGASASDAAAASGADDAYHLLLNNVPLRAFEHEATHRSSPSAGAVPTRVFNVADVPLKRWDMLVLRWTRGTHHATSSAAATTAFARVILERVA